MIESVVTEYSSSEVSSSDDLQMNSYFQYAALIFVFFHANLNCVIEGGSQ